VVGLDSSAVCTAHIVAHAAGESILCRERWRRGSSQMTLGMICYYYEELLTEELCADKADTVSHTETLKNEQSNGQDWVEVTVGATSQAVNTARIHHTYNISVVEPTNRSSSRDRELTLTVTFDLDRVKVNLYVKYVSKIVIIWTCTHTLSLTRPIATLYSNVDGITVANSNVSSGQKHYE